MCSRMPGSGARRAQPSRILQGRGRRRLCRDRGRAGRGRAAAPRPGRARSRRWSISPTPCRRTFPTFFGVPGIEMQKQFDFKKDGFNLNWWRIIEHAGTHLDAPIHFSENGATAEKIVAGELVVPLAVIDVRKQAAKNPDYLRRRRGHRGSGRRSSAGCRTIAASRCMSGWAQHVGDAAKFTGKDAGGTFHFPGFSPEAAEWLLKERKVARPRGRHAVARQRPVEGFQDPSHLAAVRPLGPGERRQPRQGAARRRDAGGRARQGEGRDRRPGPADRAGLMRTPNAGRDPACRRATRREGAMRRLPFARALQLDHSSQALIWITFQGLMIFIYRTGKSGTRSEREHGRKD